MTTTYTYDALNRVTFRDYSDATPDITYTYDDAQVAFSKGKLTKISSAVSETAYTAFDAADRLLGSRQTTDGQNYTFGYTYDLGGNLLTQTYPSTKVVKYEYGSDGDLAQVSNNQTQKVYANSFGYAAHGQVEKVRLGNGKWETTAFNSRLQITQIGLGHSQTDASLWKTNYEYGEWDGATLNGQKNNGNVARQTFVVPTIGASQGFTAIQNYTYDSLDRLKSSEEKVGGVDKWKQTFLYDRFGNRNFDTTNNRTTLQSVESNVPKIVNPEALQTNNRFKQDQDNDSIADYLYDASGNVTKDAQDRAFTYDAENRQLTATGNNLSMSYAYDGNGKRVKSYNAVTSQTTIFVYDGDGQLAAEYTINVPAPPIPTISYTTEDALGRPLKAKAAVGTSSEVWTQTEYDDVLRRVVTRSDLFTKGDGKKISVQHSDQLGRVRLTRTIENAATENPYNEQHGIKVQTRYSISGNYSYQLVSNPYRANYSFNAGSEPSMGWTRGRTINTGRHSETETFAGATLPAPFLSSGYNTNTTGKAQTDTDADRTLVTDQAGKQRISQTNALGQLVNVWEITAADSATVSVTFNQTTAAGYSTSYEYDTLNNLTKVMQGTAQTNRAFSYSSLSRLTSASNPESGTISYIYDNNGNLTGKTDARSIQTSYAYDELNRVKTRNYSDNITPNVAYTYDNKGHLTKVSSSVSETEYTAFDLLGRVTAHKQTTNGTSYTTGYVYNLSGALIEQTYPSGRIVKNVLDNDGSLSIVQSKKNSNAGYWNYADSFTYTAAGAVSSMQLGNGKWESTQFNSRLQPTQIALGTVQNGTDKLKLNFDYGTTANNGNVQSQTITVPTVGATAGFTATQNYTYDSLNRLKSATETISSSQTWKQTFQYDRYGNRTFDEANTTASQNFPKNCGGAVCSNDVPIVNPTIDASKNRLVGYTYDASGNTTKGEMV